MISSMPLRWLQRKARDQRIKKRPIKQVARLRDLKTQMTQRIGLSESALLILLKGF